MTEEHKLDFGQRQLAEVLANEIADCMDVTDYAHELIWLRQQAESNRAAIGELVAALKDATKALGDLSFECDGVFGHCATPSVSTYNRTFDELLKARAAITKHDTSSTTTTKEQA